MLKVASVAREAISDSSASPCTEVGSVKHDSGVFPVSRKRRATCAEKALDARAKDSAKTPVQYTGKVPRSVRPSEYLIEYAEICRAELSSLKTNRKGGFSDRHDTIGHHILKMFGDYLDVAHGVLLHVDRELALVQHVLRIAARNQKIGDPVIDALRSVTGLRDIVQQGVLLHNSHKTANRWGK